MVSAIGWCRQCHAQYDFSGRPAGANFPCRCGGTIRAPEPESARNLAVARCASCGAARVAAASACAYCGAAFRSVDLGWGLLCPACFCRLPNDAHFCVACGLLLQPEPLEEAVVPDLKCPRCATAMAERKVEGLRFFECALCGGLWAPTAVFESICTTREKIGEARRALGLFTPPSQPGDPGQQPIRYLPCPGCGAMMNRRNFGNTSGTIIDVCKGCGVWFDYQELNQIVRFIDSGDWARARERARAEEESAERARPRAGPARWHVSGGEFVLRTGPASPGDGPLTAGKFLEIVLKAIF